MLEGRERLIKRENRKRVPKTGKAIEVKMTAEICGRFRMDKLMVSGRSRSRRRRESNIFGDIESRRGKF